MKKWLILVVVAAAGYWGFLQWRNWQAKSSLTKTPARSTSALVIQTNISFAVSAAGEIGPAEQVSVRPEINGKINVLPVDIGDRVKKDALLFSLDDKELSNELESVKTSVERAQLELEQSDRNYKRSQELHTANLISQELYEDTKTKYELAKNSLERSRRELAIIQERLTKTQVKAPFDCTVLTRPVSIGQAVSGSGGFNSGTEVLTIADLRSMVINAHVNQADVPRLRVDQEVEVAVEAVAGLKVIGTVERIAPQATIKNNIKGFAARILLKDVDQRVRPGMTANIKIPVASAANVLAVPLAAVFTERNADSQQMERFVYIQKGETYEKRVVEIGVSDYFYAEVQRGLSPGETVSTELPKEERDKQVKSMAGARPGTGDAVASTTRTGTATNGVRVGTAATPASPARTNAPTTPAPQRPGTTGTATTAPRPIASAR